MRDQVKPSLSISTLVEGGETEEHPAFTQQLIHGNG